MSYADLTDRLDAALEAVLAVRVALGGLPADAAPFEALDDALRSQAEYQTARRAFVAALKAIRAGSNADEHVFVLEASANEMVARAAEVGWRLGIAAGTR